MKEIFLSKQHSFDENKIKFSRSQYNDVLFEFFQSIDLMVTNKSIDNYTPLFMDKYWSDDDGLSPFEFAVKDALEFVNQLYCEVRGNSIPDINLGFSHHWYKQRQDKIDAGKADAKTQKEAARYRLIYRVDSEDDLDKSDFLINDFNKFSEEEKTLIRYERSVIWKHINIGEILSNGEPVGHYEQYHLDIARYQLEDLAKIYTNQDSLKSSLFLRLILDALMFADCLNYLRVDLNLPSNERITKSEVRARLFNSGWLSWLFFIIGLFIVGASFIFFESNWVGITVIAFLIFSQFQKRRRNSQRLETYAQIFRPYNLLEGGDEQGGYVDGGVIRKAMEKVDVKYQVFTPINYKLVDRLN